MAGNFLWAVEEILKKYYVIFFPEPWFNSKVFKPKNVKFIKNRLWYLKKIQNSHDRATSGLTIFHRLQGIVNYEVFS